MTAKAKAEKKQAAPSKASAIDNPVQFVRAAPTSSSSRRCREYQLWRKPKAKKAAAK